MTTENFQPAARGTQLVRAVLERAEELGIESPALAERLGYTEPYWKAFVRGTRWIGAVGTEKLQAIADFLEKPLLTVFVMAEVLDAKSFVYRASLAKSLADGYRKMTEHDTLRNFAPDKKSWDETPEATKLLCVYLVSRLLNEELIDLASEGVMRRPLL